MAVALCSSRKYPHSLRRRDWKFLGGGGLEDQKILRNVWSLIEISRGAGKGGSYQNPFCGGRHGYFMELHIVHYSELSSKVDIQCRVILRMFTHVNLTGFTCVK